MYVYQQRENDRVCVQFRSRQVPAETPDVVIEKDDEDMINIYVAGEVVWSGQGTTFDGDDGGDTPGPTSLPC